MQSYHEKTIVKDHVSAYSEDENRRIIDVKLRFKAADVDAVLSSRDTMSIQAKAYEYLVKNNAFNPKKTD